MTATFVAGQILTASALNAAINRHEPLYAQRATDLTVTSNITPADDDELLISLGSDQLNKSFKFTGFLVFDGAEAGDIRLRWTFPTGCTFTVGGIGPANTITGGAAGDGDFLAHPPDTTSPSGEFLYGVIPAGTGRLTAIPKGVLAVGGTTGTFRLQWAQRVSSGTGTVLRTGSWIELREV